MEIEKNNRSDDEGIPGAKYYCENLLKSYKVAKEKVVTSEKSRTAIKKRVRSKREASELNQQSATINTQKSVQNYRQKDKA